MRWPFLWISGTIKGRIFCELFTMQNDNLQSSDVVSDS